MLLKLGPGTQQLPELVRGKREESPTLWVSLWYSIKSQYRSKRFITSIFTGEIYTCFLQRNWPKSRELNWEEETPTGISAKTCSWWQPQLSHTRQSPAQTPKPGECRGGRPKNISFGAGTHSMQGKLPSHGLREPTGNSSTARASPRIQSNANGQEESTALSCRTQASGCRARAELAAFSWNYSHCNGTKQHDASFAFIRGAQFFFVGCCCLNYILLF